MKQFVRLLVLLLAASLLMAACAPAAPAEPNEVEVEVTKIVKETVVVPAEVSVEESSGDKLVVYMQMGGQLWLVQMVPRQPLKLWESN